MLLPVPKFSRLTLRLSCAKVPTPALQVTNHGLSSLAQLNRRSNTVVAHKENERGPCCTTNQSPQNVQTLRLRRGPSTIRANAAGGTDLNLAPCTTSSLRQTVRADQSVASLPAKFRQVWQGLLHYRTGGSYDFRRHEPSCHLCRDSAPLDAGRHLSQGIDNAGERPIEEEQAPNPIPAGRGGNEAISAARPRAAIW